MHKISLLVVAGVLASLAGGCGRRANFGLGVQRQSQYQRLAFVCAPGGEADPAYVGTVLNETRRTAPSRLSFLPKVDFPEGVPVDTTAVPPKPAIGPDLSEYDGLACMVYSYSGGMVYLDIYMFDVKTGQSVWHHQIATRDRDVRGRLIAHGYWAPTIIKQRFYAR